MEYLKNNRCLEFHSDTLYAVREAYNLHRPGEMSAAVDILAEWVRQQNHFTKKDFSREYLERRILYKKGSIEKAKRALDKLCTMKTLLPHCFVDLNIKTDFTQYEIVTNSLFAPMPQLTEKHFRIGIVKCDLKAIPRKTNILITWITFMAYEYLGLHDYSKGYIYIVDFIGVNVAQAITVADIAQIKQTIDIFRTSCDTRLKEFHVISDSKIIDGVLNLFKQFASPKIASRIYVHSSIEAVHQSIDKDLLPIEYGGKQPSLKELHARFVDEMSDKETRDYLKTMKNARTDESKRKESKFNEMYMGVTGTFRNLVVD